jgi:hypothetical protein
MILRRGGRASTEPISLRASIGPASHRPTLFVVIVVPRREIIPRSGDRRMRKSLRIILPLALLAIAVPAVAQEEPPLDPSRVASTGARLSDFVPRGWRVAQEARGDLDGDGREDRVIHVFPASNTWYQTDGVTASPDSHALIVLLAGADGRLRRAGVAAKLLQPVAPQWGLRMNIRRGVLIVNQNYGMTDVTDVTHRFRWDAAARRFILIGRDVFSYHRPQEVEESVKRSENYLTGEALITTGRFAADGRYSETVRRERIPRAHQAMEDVDEMES